ncbi:hypothetical protein ANOM_010085 [Aspergillus nomiae NRRL 13137]|uniref:Uncharacterized protein n=1 Tax=Aspergillus nomiae NRRL (strain ATCC 15546 / NRRL 13137 / CBS 260.88 / M93) TaxID=1509407 RepID=A0A0L1ISH1_ASPN3|nr:uncharacterized protein ANOM_010085 [Aspergillus nomiae NRRL 13137]KNG82350.1 hypothetical protein ANOM_010085 [Aspergillus nomiae NRRL 13137]
MARPLAPRPPRPPSQPLPPKAPKFFCANIDAQDRVDDPPDSSVLIDYIRNAYEESVPRDEQLRKEKLFMEGVMVDAHNTDLVCVFVDVPNTCDATGIICSSICELERRYQDVAEDHIGRPRRPNDTGYYNDHFVWGCGIHPGHPHASLRPGFARICFAFPTKAEHSGHVVQQVYRNLKAVYRHRLLRRCTLPIEFRNMYIFVSQPIWYFHRYNPLTFRRVGRLHDIAD